MGQLVQCLRAKVKAKQLVKAWGQQEWWLLAATHWMVAPLVGAWGAQPPPASVANRLYILAEHSSPWLPVHIPAHATQLVEEQNET